MKRSTKYSVLIAATLLAVSPVVIDNVNHNNGNAIVKAAVNQPGDMNLIKLRVLMMEILRRMNQIRFVGHLN